MSKKVQNMEIKDKRIAEAKDDKKSGDDIKRGPHGPGVCVEILL